MTIEAPGIEHWRAIYLVEGIITMGVAVLAFFLLKDDSDSAGFLTTEDKEKLRLWHLRDRPDETLAFSWAEVRDAFKMPLTWVNGLQAVGVGLPIFSSASFFPSIVAGLGYSNAQAQLMTVPVSGHPAYKDLPSTEVIEPITYNRFISRTPFRRQRSF